MPVASLPVYKFDLVERVDLTYLTDILILNWILAVVEYPQVGTDIEVI